MAKYKTANHGVDIQSLLEEVRSLKKTVRLQEKQIQVLEERVQAVEISKNKMDEETVSEDASYSDDDESSQFV